MEKKFCLWLLACLLTASAWSQNRQVTGRVVSDGSQPLSGVNVSVKGTSTTVATNVNGQFSINIPARDNVVLTFSSVGYIPQDIHVGKKSVLEVKLSEANSSLNEVVVIGYQSVKRREVSGTVSSIQAKDLEKIPVASAAEAITGRMPGVQVVTTDGAPGADIVIRVRGGGSITQDNTPLYIVDGFPVSSISDISPSDIASIDVLKDAATAAIYGARGANGVVIITTKSAKAGKTTISYNAYAQARTLPKELKVLSPYEYVLAQYEYARTRSQSDVDNFSKYFGVYDDLELYKNQKGTDWQDKLFGTPRISQMHDFSITGGTAKTKIGLTVTNNKDEGLMPGSGYLRNYLNFKLNHQVSDALKFDFASRFTHTVVDGAGTSGGASVRIGDAITTRPVNGIADQIVIDPSGPDDEYEQFLKSVIDPIALTAQDYRQRINKALNMNAAASWSILSNLTYRSEFGLDLNFGQSKRYYGPLTGESRNNGGNLPLGELTNSETRGLRWTNTVNYQLRKGEHHDFNFLAGQEIVTVGAGNSSFTRSKYFAENMKPESLFANMQLGTPDRQSTDIEAGAKTASFFGRMIYQFDRKYILNLTARYDGSSRFAPGKQWGLFPAASFAWRVSDEKFMRNLQPLSDLKLRLSYGEAGNDKIASDQWRVLYGPSDNRPIGFGDVAQSYYTYSSSQLPNPSLKWETTVTRNAGIDFGLFGRLNGTLDVYWNTTKDLLLASAIPPITGFTTQLQNVGQTSNRGVELGLTGDIINKKDFSLSANFNIGMNRARIDKLNGLEENQVNSNWAGTDLKTQDDYRLRVGQTIGLMYGYVTDGFYKVEDFQSYDPVTKAYTLKAGVPNIGAFMGGISLRPGILKLRDLDSNGKIDANDRTVIGHALPKHSGGFGVNATFKNFDFLAFFNWMYGNQVYNTGKISFNMYYRTSYGNMLNTMNYDNRFKYIDASGNLVTDLGELQKLNANATIWSPFSMGNAAPVFHSWAVEDGSFLRLQNISLGYSLPKKMISHLYMSKLRVYFTVYNAFLWTNYTGYDPEVSVTRSGGYSQLTPGVDFSGYPKSRNYTAGINVTF
jgi:TonB-dependent starch-binding outer membrane protein SusC